MSSPKHRTWIFTGVLATTALICALSTYTFPSGGAGSWAIRATILAALGDSASVVPTSAAMAALPAAAALRPAPAPELAEERRWHPAGPGTRRNAGEWARAAAGFNPRALRRWLTAPQLTTRETSRDTTFVTSRRLSVGEDCPLISTLRSVFVRDADRLQLVRLESNCPARPAPGGAQGAGA